MKKASSGYERERVEGITNDACKQVAASASEWEGTTHATPRLRARLQRVARRFHRAVDDGYTPERNFHQRGVSPEIRI
jgi:hypothetical protein